MRRFRNPLKDLPLAWARATFIAGLLLTQAACGGGGGGAAPSIPPMPSDVGISGQVTYDRVPHHPSGIGLDYSAIVRDPVRGAPVELMDAGDGTTVLASGVTDDNGDYALDGPPTSSTFLRVRAELVRTGTPNWHFRVVDNTNADALYVLDGGAFNTGTQPVTRNLNAGSGWDDVAMGYTNSRAAAPFSVLDVAYQAVQLVLSADPDAVFAPLDLHWSENNVPAAGNIDAGLITTTFYSDSIGGGGIFILGDEDNDTDEYDQHVLAHEWGHYFEFNFSRSDSVGGSHGPGDQLDPRLAFGEGFGNALSGMVMGDSLYRDSLFAGQASGFRFDVEGEDAFWPAALEGWFSEGSVQEILYDLFDGAADISQDTLSLGFGPIYSVFTNQQLNTPALTSIFSFLAALKADLPADAAAIDGLTALEGIDPVQDAFGQGETNGGNPTSNDVLPVYKNVIAGGAATEVCSIVSFGNISGLGVSQFLRVAITASGSYQVTATPTVVPAGQLAAARIVFHQMGRLTDPDSSPASATLQTGDAVIEVYERTNAEGGAIGRTCFNVTIQ